MVKVASIQLWHSDDDSKQDRITHAEQLIDSVADSDLILLPEIWNIGWWSFGEVDFVLLFGQDKIYVGMGSDHNVLQPPF